MSSNFEIPHRISLASQAGVYSKSNGGGARPPDLLLLRIRVETPRTTLAQKTLAERTLFPSIQSPSMSTQSECSGGPRSFRLS